MIFLSLRVEYANAGQFHPVILVVQAPQTGKHAFLLEKAHLRQTASQKELQTLLQDQADRTALCWNWEVAGHDELLKPVKVAQLGFVVQSWEAVKWPPGQQVSVLAAHCWNQQVAGHDLLKPVNIAQPVLVVPSRGAVHWAPGKQVPVAAANHWNWKAANHDLVAYHLSDWCGIPHPVVN